MADKAPDLESIVLKALERKSTSERRAYLDERCGADKELRRQVERRLATLDTNDSLDQTRTQAPEIKRSDLLGTSIGNYKLVESIGEGGMGVVYLAQQRKPVKRRVALKVIKPGMDTKEVMARFEAERQALAMMNHTNIARVFDAGETEAGHPYFVMEYVPGVPITKYCDQAKLGMSKRLGLFRDVCMAIQHAHQKGIIHRDIKPSNILVSTEADKPIVKIIDFGVAKAVNQSLTEHTIHTQAFQVLGTPLYMSPEQAEMSGIDIDTRSDIYSLGVVLYELLTGKTPFDKARFRKAAYQEMWQIIREEEPVKPSTKISELGDTASQVSELRNTDPKRLRQSLRGDLDWIVLKAIEKDRTRRYETANGLALDITRLLEDRPVSAGPPSAAYQIRKFIKRNTLGVAAAGLVAAALILGIIGTSSGMLWALNERTRANEETERAKLEAKKAGEVGDFLTDMMEGASPLVALGRDSKLLVDILEQSTLEVDNNSDLHPEVEAMIRNSLGISFHALNRLEEADKQLTAALKLRKQSHTGDHLDIAESMSQLARLRKSQVKLDDAKELAKQALAMAERVRPADHEDLFPYLLLLSNLQSTDEKPEHLESSSNLASRALQNAIDNKNRKNESEAISQLANLHRLKGEFEEAKVLRLKAIEIYENLFGKFHPTIAKMQNNLAMTYQDLGEEDLAGEMFDESLSNLKHFFGDQDPVVAAHILNSIHALAARGNFAKAAKVIRDALKILEATYPGDHPDTAYALNGIGAMLIQSDKDEEAEPFVLRSLAMHKRLYGDKSWWVASEYQNLGVIYRQTKRFDESEEYYQKAFAVKRELGGEDSVQFLSTLESYALLSLARGDVENAERIIRKVIKKRIEIQGKDHFRIGTSYGSLGEILAGKQDFESAELAYRKAISVVEQELGHDEIRTLQYSKDLAVVLFKLSKFTEAETLALDTYKRMAAKVGDKDERLKDYRSAIFDLYSAWHKAEPKAGHDAKASRWK